MIVGGDPAALDRLAAAGAGHAFALDHAARQLDQAGHRHRSTTPGSRVHTAAAVAALRRLAAAIIAVDGWVRGVAAALRDADRAPLACRLLALGAHHPTALHDPATVPARTLVASLTAAELAALATVPRLPGPWRDRVHRERVRRWVDELDERIAGVPADQFGSGALDRFARWVDTTLVDRLSPLVDLHVTRDETVARLRAEATGARSLLADRDVEVWSFDPTPDGRATLRLALGDPGTATHLAVLQPGAGSGVHGVRDHLADARALHRHAVAARPDGVRVATVLDLHAAPPDLGAAADPAPSRVAGAAAAAFLDDLPASPTTTLVGHSYGALVAARTSDDHPVDDLVLLGAPGAGVTARSELAGATRVWAARAGDDPIGLVADLDEHIQRLPPSWRPGSGPLASPAVAHGPDPADPEFGARVLPTAARGPGVAGPPARGHLEYLRPGSASLAGVARIVVGRRPT